MEHQMADLREQLTQAKADSRHLTVQLEHERYQHVSTKNRLEEANSAAKFTQASKPSTSPAAHSPAASHSSGSVSPSRWTAEPTLATAAPDEGCVVEQAATTPAPADTAAEKRERLAAKKRASLAGPKSSTPVATSAAGRRSMTPRANTNDSVVMAPIAMSPAAAAPLSAKVSPRPIASAVRSTRKSAATPAPAAVVEPATRGRSTRKSTLVGTPSAAAKISAVPVQQDFASMTIVQLKDALAERGIPLTGLKLKKDYVTALQSATLFR
jgi:hypothetical protein